jgi:hypothetical protein
MALLTACGDDTPAKGGTDVTAADAGLDAGADAGADAGVDVSGPDVPPTVEDNFGVAEDQGEVACDNLDPTHCMFPFPSDRFRVVDGAGVGSLVLDGATPMNLEGARMDAQHFRSLTGFSPLSPILFGWPDVAVANAAPMADVAASLLPGSPTVFINADTGERIPHWVELDHFGLDAGFTVVGLRTAVHLDYDARYIIAVRELVDGAGAPVEASPGFAALRDATASHVRGVHARRARFEAEVFAPLAAAGVDRAELQLAFDFTTATEPDLTGLAIAMRDTLMAAIGEDGPEYTISSVVDPGDPDIAWLVTGVAQIPSFLLPPDDEVRRIRRDASGAPVIEGFEEIIFELQIPHSVMAAPGDAAVVQYGHGLLYSRQEARKDWLRAMANREGFLILATNLQGMAEPDTVTWATVIGSNFGRFPLLSEAPWQGLMNHLALIRMMKGRFTAEADPVISNAGTPRYDNQRLFYYGNSQGGSMGTNLISLSQDVTRAGLGVPGGSFGLLLHRSADFAAFSSVLQLTYEGLDFVALFPLIQAGFDRLDGIHYLHRATADPLPNTPTHHVLVHIAKEDAVVHNQVSYLVARRVGAPLLTPAVRPVFGLEEVTSPHQGSATAEYDFGHPANPQPWYPPPKESDTHEDLRRLRTAQDQLWHFLDTGEVVHLCDGVCDPD